MARLIVIYDRDDKIIIQADRHQRPLFATLAVDDAMPAAAIAGAASRLGMLLLEQLAPPVMDREFEEVQPSPVGDGDHSFARSLGLVGLYRTDGVIFEAVTSEDQCLPWLDHHLIEATTKAEAESMWRQRETRDSSDLCWHVCPVGKGYRIAFMTYRSPPHPVRRPRARGETDIGHVGDPRLVQRSPS